MYTLPQYSTARHKGTVQHRARKWLLMAMLAVSGFPTALVAQSVFAQADVENKGRVMAFGAQPGAPLYAGQEVSLNGRGFVPGQQLSISRLGTLLNADGNAVADEKGNFSATFKLPADAAPGQHTLSIVMANPGGAAVAPIQVSPHIALSGKDKFTTHSQKLVQGLYQSAYSPAGKAVFVTSAVGRPPVSESRLLKVNPETLEIMASVTPAAVPEPRRPEGASPMSANAQKDAARRSPVFAVYGVGVDDSKGTVWVTNTRQSTVAVYRQSDLALVKQLEPETVSHPRDVVVNGKLNKAYVSSAMMPNVAVFDTNTDTLVKNIEIHSKERDGKFGSGSLHLDGASGKLFVVSMSSDELAVIDTLSDTVLGVYPLAGARTSIGVDYDAKGDRVFVVARGSDNLLIVDGKTGKVLHNVLVGAGALNVAFDPVHRLAYVSNRGAGTVTVVDPDGNIVANLDGGTFPNHVAVDGKGSVFAINKSRGADDPQGDRITRITPRR